MATHDVLVLVSGGVDSCVCLSMALELGSNVAALHVSYGQPAESLERTAAETITAHFGVQLQHITVAGLAIPSSGYIAGRNLVLAALALASTQRAERSVVLGVHAGTRYPDCTEDFVRAVQNAFDTYADGRVQVHAPLIGWSKAAVFEYCRTKGIPMDLTYSCEAGTVPPCGTCDSCRDRATYGGR